MRTLNLAAKTIFALALVAGLSACGKKKTSSTAATTPVVNGQCQWNPTYNQNMIVGTTTPCVPTTTGNQCVYNPTTGTNTIPGTNTPCQTSYPTAQSCDQYTQYYSNMYGYPIYYVPMQLGGQYYCVNMQYLNQFNPHYGNQYYYPGYTDYDYYQDYYYDVPYYDQGCSTQIDIGFGNFYGGVCF